MDQWEACLVLIDRSVGNGVWREGRSRHLGGLAPIWRLRPDHYSGQPVWSDDTLRPSQPHDFLLVEIQWQHMAWFLLYTSYIQTKKELAQRTRELDSRNRKLEMGTAGVNCFSFLYLSGVERLQFAQYTWLSEIKACGIMQHLGVRKKIMGL